MGVLSRGEGEATSVTGHPFFDPDRRPAPRRRGGRGTVDEVVAERVVRAIFGDPHVRSGRLDVLVQNGVAILDGCVPSEDARAALIHRVRATPGVRDVVNMVTVDDVPTGP